MRVHMPCVHAAAVSSKHADGKVKGSQGLLFVPSPLPALPAHIATSHSVRLLNVWRLAIVAGRLDISDLMLFSQALSLNPRVYLFVFA